MANPPLLTLKDIHLTFGGTPLIEGAELSVAAGDRLCLVGRNGSGKSTLLKIAAGQIEPDSGTRFAHPGAVIRYLPQEADFSGFKTTSDYVAAGLSPTDDPYRGQVMLSELGLSGEEDPAQLSGGEARRTALARVLAPRPDVLLLDEPTNHLDLPAIEWLEAELKTTKAALVLISHDRRFLENLSRSTIWLDRGIARRLDQGFASFEAWRDQLLEQEETERHKLDRKIVREEQWMHGGVTGRRKRNVRRVAELRAMRNERSEFRRAQGNVVLEASESQLSGKLVIEAKNLTKSYGGNPVVQDFSLRVLRGDRIGFVGPNGAGKTTLIRMLTGDLTPDSGDLRLGTNLELVMLDQKRDDLDPNATVAHALTGGRGDQVIINGKARHVASYMKDFLFLPEQARSPLYVLSGGERGRLMLARALAKPSNLLVLDEPTNDLDLETLDLLQELLADYPGTILLVSHDRDFLDRVVTSVIVPEGEGRWREYPGGYSDMIAQCRGAMDIAPDKGMPAPERREKSSVSEKSGNERGAAQRKLSFKEKHALEKLPGQIDALQGEIQGLHARIADANFYAKDPGGFTQASERLAAAERQLAQLEEEWLELEMKREELEG
ncbi:ATP-binding cassette domain-containing protein [Filomicrobium sp.]|uniref:ABC-F family ATP-binding cassette domain-containing protein n=1 Tax=Filomicrobium sp. TaxID=2024831 RepID=UPI00258CFFA6|nr:ATP-binding cassette domain-containing protein [Filomicrobium sp.]MCV0367910.1 ATP-binding cassette domain-containing protein [Filomicrobium sp.]